MGCWNHDTQNDIGAKLEVDPSCVLSGTLIESSCNRDVTSNKGYDITYFVDSLSLYLEDNHVQIEEEISNIGVACWCRLLQREKALDSNVLSNYSHKPVYALHKVHVYLFITLLLPVL